MALKIALRDMSEQQRADYELAKATRKLLRAITPRKFKTLGPATKVYKEPLAKHWKGDYCGDCERKVAFYSRLCCECFQKQCRRKLAAKQRKDAARIKKFVKTFNRVIQQGDSHA